MNTEQVRHRCIICKTAFIADKHKDATCPDCGTMFEYDNEVLIIALTDEQCKALYDLSQKQKKP